MAAAARLSLGARTVHIKIYPTARTFAERTEVLRVLERFGQVDYFKSLRGYAIPNAFITIFNKAEAAELAVNTSPVRYRLLPTLPTDAPIFDAGVAYNQLPNDESEDIKELDALEEANDLAGLAERKNKMVEPPQEKIFELKINPSQYPHQKFIARSPLYGSWNPIPPSGSAIAADLTGRLPAEKILRGLRDWETGAMSGEYDYDSSIDGMDESSGTTVRSNMPWRFRGKVAQTETPPIRGLWGMYEEGQREIEERMYEESLREMAEKEMIYEESLNDTDVDELWVEQKE